MAVALLDGSTEDTLRVQLLVKHPSCTGSRSCTSFWRSYYSRAFGCGVRVDVCDNIHVDATFLLTTMADKCPVQELASKLSQLLQLYRCPLILVFCIDLYTCALLWYGTV